MADKMADKMSQLKIEGSILTSDFHKQVLPKLTREKIGELLKNKANEEKLFLFHVNFNWQCAEDATKERYQAIKDHLKEKYFLYKLESDKEGDLSRGEYLGRIESPNYKAEIREFTQKIRTSLLKVPGLETHVLKVHFLVSKAIYYGVEEAVSSSAEVEKTAAEVEKTIKTEK